MPEPTQIRLKIEQKGVLSITLNRPEKCNALNIRLLEELARAVETAKLKKGLRVIIIRGEGKAFCAGLDLKEAMDHSVSHHSAELIARVLRSIYLSPLFTIAAVHGAAVAGGAGLMSACDYIVAAEGTTIAYPETRRGLVPGLVMTILRRQVSERRIRELVLLAENVTPERALDLGIINKIVKDEDLTKEALSIAKLALQGSPQAIAHTKELLDDLYPASLSQDLEHALRHHMEARRSNEGKEGVEAFLKKRVPAWAEE
ncbi:3-hydroxypropionyl-coenzyme A dehydratase [Chlamydiales bacterium SCGC AG-110-M15]|nr:3-hydroxypropionyl-coenzyme A dehydratase [Chlamydiales bacterium SCGC AG-110-M15]